MKRVVDDLFGKGNEGIEVVKIAGKAIGVTLGLVAFSVALGAVDNAFKTSN
jgi:hypothetical protein